MQLALSLEGVVTQTLMKTADGQGRVPALEVLIPDDAIRNLIRQGKVEQVYSFMQTGTKRGMQTLEQSLGDLISKHLITVEQAISRSTRPEQLIGQLERSGIQTGQTPTGFDGAPGSGLRVAGT
jgi:twitching motility protein PilT